MSSGIGVLALPPDSGIVDDLEGSEYKWSVRNKTSTLLAWCVTQIMTVGRQQAAEAMQIKNCKDSEVEL